MNTDNTDFERINDYLLGRLSELEHAAFEADLRQNAALQQAVTEEKRFQRGLRAVAIRDQLRAIEASEQAAARRPMPSWTTTGGWGAYALAASVLVVLGLGVYLWQAQTGLRPANNLAGKTPAPQADTLQDAPSIRVAQHGIPDTATSVAPVTIPHPKAAPSAEQQLLAAFKTLTANLPIDRQLAQITLPDEPTRGDGTEADALAQGRQLFRKGRLNDAEAVLGAVAESDPGDEWGRSAQWYLVGIYLKTHRLAQARQQLRAIAQTAGHPQQQAAKLLLAKHSN